MVDGRINCFCGFNTPEEDGFSGCISFRPSVRNVYEICVLMYVHYEWRNLFVTASLVCDFVGLCDNK